MFLLSARSSPVKSREAEIEMITDPNSKRPITFRLGFPNTNARYRTFETRNSYKAIK
jgi:hypothetical protein